MGRNEEWERTDILACVISIVESTKVNLHYDLSVYVPLCISLPLCCSCFPCLKFRDMEVHPNSVHNRHCGVYQREMGRGCLGRMAEIWFSGGELEIA